MKRVMKRMTSLVLVACGLLVLAGDAQAFGRRGGCRQGWFRHRACVTTVQSAQSCASGGVGLVATGCSGGSCPIR